MVGASRSFEGKSANQNKVFDMKKNRALISSCTYYLACGRMCTVQYDQQGTYYRLVYFI